MSRPRKKGDDKIALFPFLSVLICTIGVLTLILVSSVIGQVDEASANSPDNKYREIQKKIREKRRNAEGQAQRLNNHNAAVFDYYQRLKKLKQKLEQYGEVSTPEGILKYKNLTNQVGQLKKTSNEVKSEIVVLDEKLEKEDANGTIRAQKPNKGAQEIEGLRSDFILVEGKTEALQIRINEKKKDLEEMDRVLAELEKQKMPLTGVLPATEKDLEELAKRIERAMKVIEEAEKMAIKVKKDLVKQEQDLEKKTGGKGPAVGIAGKTRGGRTPRYVECMANGQVTIHSPNGQKQNLQIIRSIQDREKFRDFLKTVRPKEIVVMLLRPSGVGDTLKEAKKLCEKERIKPGYLPLEDDQKPVRFLNKD